MVVSFKSIERVLEQAHEISLLSWSVFAEGFSSDSYWGSLLLALFSQWQVPGLSCNIKTWELALGK